MQFLLQNTIEFPDITGGEEYCFTKGQIQALSLSSWIWEGFQKGTHADFSSSVGFSQYQVYMRSGCGKAEWKLQIYPFCGFLREMENGGRWWSKDIAS